MGLPKKIRKKNINLYPGKAGYSWNNEDCTFNYTDNGRREEMFRDITDGATALPRSVLHEDLDKGFIDHVKKKFELVIQGKKVPVIFLTLQRWSEFNRTWQHSDKYKNIKIPFITIVRQPNPQVGTNQSSYHSIPERHTFTYFKVPTWDGNRKGMDIYKIPQPVPVDMTYEVRFYSYRMRELNKFNRKILQAFASKQSYTNIKGHYFPIHLESIGDESSIDNFEEKRFYIQSYEMKMLGYLLDEEEFEVTPAINKTLVMTEPIEKCPRVVPTVTVNKRKDDEGNEIVCNFLFEVGCPSVFALNGTPGTYVNLFTKNVQMYEIRVNGNLVSPSFTLGESDMLSITIIREDITQMSEITIKGFANAH